MIQFILPLLSTLLWFYHGFNNLDDWGYPQYLLGLDWVNMEKRQVN